MWSQKANRKKKAGDHEYAHQSKKAQDSLHSDFDFSLYLTYLLSDTLVELVEFGVVTWAVLWLVFAGFWAIVKAADDHVQYVCFSLIAFQFLLCFLLLLIRFNLRKACYQLQPRHLERAADTVYRRLRVGGINENSPLLAATDAAINQSVMSLSQTRKGTIEPDYTSKDSADRPLYQLLPAVKQPTNKVVRWFYQLKEEDKIDRHARLFWGTTAGAYYTRSVLRLTLLLNSVYIGVWMVVYLVPVAQAGPGFEDINIAVRVVVIFTACLPTLLVQVLFRSCLTCVSLLNMPL